MASLTYKFRSAMIIARGEINGWVLAQAARFDLKLLAEDTFGNTHIANNSKALRIAAENKSYGVLGHMLNVSAESVLPSRTSFRLGSDFDKAVELMNSDPKMKALYKDHEKKCEQALDDVFSLMDKMVVVPGPRGPTISL